MATRLIVADPQEVIRGGVARLSGDTDVTIVAQAVMGTDAISKTRRHKPDILLMAVQLTEVDGFDGLEEIHQSVPHTRVIMMSTEPLPVPRKMSHVFGSWPRC